MIRIAFNGMIAVLLANWLFNDLPHAAGLYASASEKRVEWRTTADPEPDAPGLYTVRTVVEVGGERVGTIGVRASPGTESAAIVAVVVDQEYRRRGFGKGLLDRTMQKLRDMDVKTVMAYRVGDLGRQLITSYGFTELPSEPGMYEYKMAPYGSNPIRYSGSEDEMDDMVLGSIDAYSGDDKIGYIQYTIEPEETHVAELYVDPRYRGAGIARELVRRAEGNIRAHKVREIVVVQADEPAQRFWEHMGYKRAHDEMVKQL